jgi:hypothetical protein
VAVDDYFETEVGIAVAATAALFSPKVRRVLRRGATYGIAGALAAGEAVSATARRVGQEATARRVGQDAKEDVSSSTASAESAPTSAKTAGKTTSAEAAA